MLELLPIFCSMAADFVMTFSAKVSVLEANLECIYTTQVVFIRVRGGENRTYPESAFWKTMAKLLMLRSEKMRCHLKFRPTCIDEYEECKIINVFAEKTLNQNSTKCEKYQKLFMIAEPDTLLGRTPSACSVSGSEVRIVAQAGHNNSLFRE